MARPKNTGGRVTKREQAASPESARQSVHGGRVTESRAYEPPEIAPLYRRKPAMFAVLVLACVAMVMSMMAGIFTSL